MNPQLRSMLVTHKHGYEVPVWLGVRINSNIYNRVEYVGSLNFEVNSVETCVLVVSKSGRIMSMTKPAREYFDIEDKMRLYNSEFDSVFEVKL